MTKTGKKINGKQKLTPSDIVVHIILVILSVIWVIPILWIVLISFRGEKGQYVSTLLPKAYTLGNYTKLFTDTGILNFPKMFMNTLIIAIFSCIISTCICIGDVILYVENAFPTETPIYECSIDPWYVPGIHGYDRSLLYLKGDRTVRRILDPCCTYPGLFRWCRLTVLYCKRLL